MKFFLVLTAVTFVTGCAQTKDLFKDLKSMVMRDSESVKRLCDNEGHARSCLKYGKFLKDNGGINNVRGAYYKKSCDLGYIEGCEMHKKYIAQTESFATIKNRCLKGTVLDCIEGGLALEARNDRKEALKILKIACSRKSGESACYNIKRIQDEDKERAESIRRYEAEVAENKRRGREKLEIKKKMEAALKRCVDGDNNTCINLAKFHYMIRDLPVAIELSRIACENKSTVGCNLLTAYTKEKTDSEARDDVYYENNGHAQNTSGDQVPRKGRFIGNLNSNQYDSNSVSNPYGKYGNKFSPDSINNPYGAGNPYGQKNIKLQDQNGNFRGNLNNNPYDPDSVSNPYGRYGNKFSPDSINNPYGAGNPYNVNSPNNPYGNGLQMYQDE